MPDPPRIAVVNEHFASRFWLHQHAIGKRFHLEYTPARRARRIDPMKALREE